jgi:epsilon-lactone hydrolase
MKLHSALTLLAATSIFCVPTEAQMTKRVSADGTVEVSNASVPPSTFLSEAALKNMLAEVPPEGSPEVKPLSDNIVEYRRLYNESLQPRVKHGIELHPVNVEETTINGISVAIVTPKKGIAEENRNRILINAPGGGFRYSVRANGLLISVPTADVGGFKVVTISYRQAPEYQFPAASDDLLKVYSELRKTYPAANIGLFGCSAGGALIAHAVARLIADDQELPGAIGIYCAGAGSAFGGDSFALSAIAALPTGMSPPPDTSPDYLPEVDRKNPLVWPVDSPEVLARFPPTIFLNATRDFAMSSAAYSHRKMVEAGVDTDLLIYDGLYHGFMTNPDHPESQEAYRITTKFFKDRLGK